MVQTKAKKVDPNAAFKKRKQKVGKKKLEPLAATKAEIHAKSIFIKKQTKEVAEGEYVTNRKLTFADCITKLRHYSPQTRKDGLLELHSMVKATVETQVVAIPPSSYATLLNAALPLLIDGDVEVRKAVVALVRILVKLLTMPSHSTDSASVVGLKQLLPLIIRFVLVGLTHIEPSIRQSSCRCLLAVVRGAQGDPLPDTLTLLDCTFRLLGATTRPADGGQPPAMQVFIDVLQSALTHGPKAGPSASLLTDTSSALATSKLDLVGKASGRASSGPPPSQPTSNQPVVKLDTPQGIISYLVNTVMKDVHAMWVEATNELKKDTRVGPWETGLLQILNLLLTAAAARHPNTTLPLPSRITHIPKTFRGTIATHFAKVFPFSGTGSDAQRTNAQLALLLSYFLPSSGDTIRAWLKLFLSSPSCKTLRPCDVTAVCVVTERLDKYSPALKGAMEVEGDNDTLFEPLSSFLKESGVPGSPTLLEVSRALRRMIDECIAKRAGVPQGVHSSVALIPMFLHGLASKIGVAAPSDDTTAETLIPTVDGGVFVTATGTQRGTAELTVVELLLILVRLATCAELPDEVCEDLVPALFAVVMPGSEEWHFGLLKRLPPAHAALAVSLLPAVLASPEVDAAQLLCAVLASLPDDDTLGSEWLVLQTLEHVAAAVLARPNTVDPENSAAAAEVLRSLVAKGGPRGVAAAGLLTVLA